MSDALYRTRLRWSNVGHGVAIFEGISVELYTRPPVLEHVRRITDLEYAPLLGATYLQVGADPRRDLTPGEVAELDAYLTRIARAARAAAEAVPTT